jgi:N-acetylglutamate synthase-like GNAT family acetyltransferase
LDSSNDADIQLALAANELLVGALGVGSEADRGMDTIIVATEQDVLVGAANFAVYKRDSSAYLHGMVVAECARRRHIGSQLLTRIIATAVEAGLSTIYLNPFVTKGANNPRLFFERYGFEQITGEADAPHVGQMRLQLTPGQDKI